MATNIEIEAKVLISKNDYNKIIDYYKTTKFEKLFQINHYIDTDNLRLKGFGIGLRIREKNDGSLELTMKCPLAEGLLEKNQNITRQEYEDLKENNVFPNGQIKSFTEMLGIQTNALKILTSLKTHRLEYKFDNNVFSIDKNEYNSITDYELEMEANSIKKATEDLKTVCEKVGIDFQPNAKSKQLRAMSTIKN